jgi:hypothetical protein
VIERECKLAVYPDQNTCWHYDDKIAQAHLFKAVGIPTPKTWVWFNKDAALQWAADAIYPVVLKLWSGAQASNVRLVCSTDEAASWITRLFSSGLYSLGDEDVSRLPWKRRLKEAVRIVLAGRRSPPPHHRWDLHKNYIYFQEFIPDNEYDIRITVIGNRAFGSRRMNRPGDFRASGSGRTDRNPDLINPRATRLGFDVARRLRAQSIALDILQRGSDLLISEVSYTYPSWAIHEYPGHWELHGTSSAGELVWCGGHMWPEEAQVADFLIRLEQRSVNGGCTSPANESTAEVFAAPYGSDAPRCGRG